MRQPVTSQYRLRAGIALAAVALAGAIGAMYSGPLTAQPKSPLTNFFTEYAVKFVCGEPVGIDEEPVLANGFYSTAVNVHNPGAPVVLERKVATATLREGGPITGFSRARLDRDQAIEFTCLDIREQARVPRGSFITGFLVIHTPPRQELDVVAVYTAGSGRVAALHTERVPARAVSVPFVLGTTKNNP